MTGKNESVATPIVLISAAMAVPSRFYAPLVDAFAERGWAAEALPRRASALTEWTYRKDAAPDGGTTHHIHWVRTPGPVADRVVAWWESRN